MSCCPADDLYDWHEHCTVCNRVLPPDDAAGQTGTVRYSEAGNAYCPGHQPSGITGYTVAELLALLQDCRSYITPTISTHEELSTILGWCDCGYCTHVPAEQPKVPR